MDEQGNETAELEELWVRAVEARQDGRDDRAADLLRSILAAEPRLAEPRLELAHMAVNRGDLEEAEEQTWMAVDILGRGGQWIDDIPGPKLEAFAHNLLGEIRYARAELIAAGTDRDAFEELWNGAAEAFARAAQLDPDNEDARRNAAHVRKRG
jgi:tetratricopeptide (TPR) repeat protein